MPIALFVAGMVWAFAALALALGCKVARTQPTMYAFLDVGRSGWSYPSTYYTFVALLVLAAALCFVLSFAAWRRQQKQQKQPLQWTGTTGAFPVIPAPHDRGSDR
jgi:hypothetical protein